MPEVRIDFDSHRKAALVEDLTFMARHGEDLDGVLRRLGRDVTPTSRETLVTTLGERWKEKDLVAQLKANYRRIPQDHRAALGLPRK